MKYQFIAVHRNNIILNVKKDIVKREAEFRQPLADNIRLCLEEQYKTPWNYNEVVRWLIIYRQGIDLVGEEWCDRHCRILRNRKRNYCFNTASAIRMRVNDNDSSEKIFQNLLHEIEQYGKELRSKKRYIDVSKLKNIGQFVNWRALMDAEFDSNK